jgi:hypothetical protein
MRNVLAVVTSVSAITAALFVSGCTLKIDGLGGLSGAADGSGGQNQGTGGSTGDPGKPGDPCAQAPDPQACYAGTDPGMGYPGCDPNKMDPNCGYADGGTSVPPDPGDPDMCSVAQSPDECFSYPGCAWADDGYGQKCVYIGDPGMGVPPDGGMDPGQGQGTCNYPDDMSCLSDPSCAWCERADGTSGCHDVSGDGGGGTGNDFCYDAFDPDTCKMEGCFWDDQAYLCEPFPGDQPPPPPSMSPCDKAFDPMTCVELGCSWDDTKQFCSDGVPTMDPPPPAPPTMSSCDQGLDPMTCIKLGCTWDDTQGCYDPNGQAQAPVMNKQP